MADPLFRARLLSYRGGARSKPPRPADAVIAQASGGPEDKSSGEFGACGGQRYFEPHGARLLGGARRDRLQGLLPLGGGRYLDRSSGMLGAFTRNREGMVNGLHARRGAAGAGTLLLRKGK